MLEMDNFPSNQSISPSFTVLLMPLTRSSIQRQGLSSTPREDAERACRAGKDNDGFSVIFINDFIGSGVFVAKDVRKGSFLLEYSGELISAREGREREKNYPPEKGSFLFFKHNGSTKCVDATNHPNRAGRMVNDSDEPNAKMQVVLVDGKPHLCLFACDSIEENDEIRYDYGVPDLPWRKQMLHMEHTEASRVQRAEGGVSHSIVHDDEAASMDVYIDTITKVIDDLSEQLKCNCTAANLDGERHMLEGDGRDGDHRSFNRKSSAKVQKIAGGLKYPTRCSEATNLNKTTYEVRPTNKEIVPNSQCGINRSKSTMGDDGSSTQQTTATKVRETNPNQSDGNRLNCSTNDCEVGVTCITDKPTYESKVQRNLHEMNSDKSAGQNDSASDKRSNDKEHDFNICHNERGVNISSSSTDTTDTTNIGYPVLHSTSRNEMRVPDTLLGIDSSGLPEVESDNSLVKNRDPNICHKERGIVFIRPD
ncbi:uncharacterized protein [Apostichopus japonicus]|uniref:uncharacterized protein n=1 Tax=Stichopus japonicus TaxID=307972 RepID=UPI003AB62F82